MSSKKLSIIGSGNVANYFASTFYDNGINVNQITSKNIEHAQLLANKVNSNAIAKISDLDFEIDYLIVAVNDSSIADVLAEIPVHVSPIILHTSGNTDIKIFNPLFRNFGVLYPLQTFSKHTSLVNTNFPILLEANSKETLKKIRDLVSLFTNNIMELDSNQRQVTHLAAVFANNFTNHLFSISSSILANENIDFQILFPLLNETISKIQVGEPDAIQTGPARRNDENTMKKHQEILTKYPKNFKLIYDIISKSITQKFNSNG